MANKQNPAHPVVVAAPPARGVASPTGDRDVTSASKAETVRCEVRDASGRVLLLEKSAASKNPGMLEFPGGKIDQIRAGRSTVAEQRESVLREVLEETGLDLSDLPVERICGFSYTFDIEGIRYERDVHLWRVQLPAGDHAVQVNQTTRADGSSEDKHAGFCWVTAEEFRRLRKAHKIAANSRAPRLRRPGIFIRSRGYTGPAVPGEPPAIS